MGGDAKGADIEERLVELAAIVCGISGGLPRHDIGRHICGQLIRCGTAPAANYAEARSAESRKDFVHKMKVCLKELRETLVWLKLLLRLSPGLTTGIRNPASMAGFAVPLILGFQLGARTCS